VLSREVLNELADTLTRLAALDPPQPVVLISAHPTIFLAGAHLAEIATLDPASCLPYAERGRSVVALLESHPAPVVAAVDGSCSGGGLDLILACDGVVACPDATFSHPGVFRGLVTGWGGTVALPAAIGRPAARRAFLEGSPISVFTMKAAGVVHRVSREPRLHAAELAVKYHRLPDRRLLLWRRLRGPDFVDRFRAVVVEKL
jgi:enoyl-CoA hydratase